MNNEVDNSIPKDEVHLKMNGKAVGKIVNLEMNNDKTDEQLAQDALERLYQRANPLSAQEDAVNDNDHMIISIALGKLSEKDAEIVKLQKELSTRDNFEAYMFYLNVKKLVNPQEYLILKVSDLESKLKVAIEAYNILKNAIDWNEFDDGRYGNFLDAECLIAKIKGEG